MDENAVDDNPIHHRIVKPNARNSVILHPISGLGLPYFDDIAFRGPCSPGQIKISIDTGSSDWWLDSRLWCDRPKALVTQWARKCAAIEAASEGEQTKLCYDDGFCAYGSFVKEDLWFGRGGAILRHADFMAATSFNNRANISGMVGLGYIANQQTATFHWTLPHVLENNGNTTSQAFAMWFVQTDPNADLIAGQIYFGGYVDNYYKGNLTMLPILREPGQNPNKIAISLSEMRYKGVLFSYCEIQY